MAVFSEIIRLLIDADTKGAVTPLGQLESQAKKTDTAFDKMAKSVGISGQSLKTGLAGLAPAALTGGLVAGLTLAVTKYTEAATAANMLSEATNASIEDASRFTAVAERYGLGTSDLVEIFADFQQAAEGSRGELEKLGVTMVKTPGGATDWIATATEFLAVIQKIPDATERNRLMFKYFGEEGAKQLMSLVNSGQSVEDALNSIGDAQILHQSDIQNVNEFKDALFGVQGVGGGLANTFGRLLLPAITDVINVITPLLGALSEIPTEVLLVAGALVALNAALKVGAVQNMLGLFAALATGAVTMSTVVVGAFEAMTAAIMANPIGLIIVGVAAALAGLAIADKKYREGLREDALAILELTEAGKTYEEAIAEIEGTTVDKVKAEKLANDSSAVVYGTNVEVTKTLDAQDKAYNDLVDDVGEFGAAELIAAANTTKLEDAVATLLGTTEPTAEQMKAVADSATKLNTANLDVERSTNLAEIAMGQYAVSIQGVVEWEKRLAGIAPSIEEGINGVQEAYKTLSKTEDKKSTWGDERVIQAGKAKTALLDYVDTLAASGMTDEQIIEVLMEIPAEAGSQLAKDRDEAIAKVTGKGNEIPVDLTLETDKFYADLAKVKTVIAEPIEGPKVPLTPQQRKVEGLIRDSGSLPGAPVAPATETVSAKVEVDDTEIVTAKADLHEIEDSPVNVNVKVQGQEDATNVVTGLTHDKEIKLNVNVKGRSDAENVINGLTHDKEIPLHINIHGRSDAENVIAGLTHDKEIPLHVNIHGRSDAENVLNGLDNDRYVTIYVSTSGVQSAKDAINGINGLTVSAMGGLLGPQAYGYAAPPKPTTQTLQTITINVPGSGSPATTAREIDRYLRRAGNPAQMTVTA